MLDDGTSFAGFACGARGEAAGEAVFTTGMTGWQETLTDPSYHGQIVAFTAAHVGNYGACRADDENGLIRAGGAVFHDVFLYDADIDGAAPFPHWRADTSLDMRLKQDGVTGIYGVDTRALTLHLREHGSRNGIISAHDLNRESLLARVRNLPAMQGRDLVCAVSSPCSYAYRSHLPESPAYPPARAKGGVEENAPSPRVAVYDFGVKRSILESLSAAGLAPTVWPAATPAKDVLASKPDGILLSNGPGDPEPCGYAVAAVRQLLGRVPLFGICLGHQILALALGGKTYKLPFGHHGVNHPVKDLRTGRVWITSQNHGFCVDPESLPASVSPSHSNLNDHTLEGMVCKDVPAFSVQFHPESGPGPHDAASLFTRFHDMIRSRNESR